MADIVSVMPYLSYLAGPETRRLVSLPVSGYFVHFGEN